MRAYRLHPRMHRLQVAWPTRLVCFPVRVTGRSPAIPFRFPFLHRLATRGKALAGRSRPTTPSPNPRNHPMNYSKTTSPRRRAFTLIELLVVISIIGVLASMLLPVLSRVKVRSQVAKAKVEINGITGAINSYYATYSRFPSSKKLRESLNQESPDFTFGTTMGANVWWKNKKGIESRIESTGLNYRANNSEVIAILNDIERFRNGRDTVNLGHAYNPQKVGFLKGVNEVDAERQPGIGPDGVYRDPWGNPYIITLDFNYDGKCFDGFYRHETVSRVPGDNNKGYNGLFKASDDPDNAASYAARVEVMVWSMGPDGVANASKSALKDENKDNILSWGGK